MAISATEAKNQFGNLCQQAKLAPVVVEKAGVPDTVLLSYDDYQRLLKPAAASLRERRKRFNTEHAQWIAAVNAHVDRHGLWSDELRTW